MRIKKYVRTSMIGAFGIVTILTALMIHYFVPILTNAGPYIKEPSFESYYINGYSFDEILVVGTICIIIIQSTGLAFF